MLRWHTLAVYFRRKYGTRVQKIPLDAGASPVPIATERSRVIKASCTFCNASGSGSGLGGRGFLLTANGWPGLKVPCNRCRQGLYGLSSVLLQYLRFARTPATLLQQVAALPGCLGVAVGTRPDCLGPRKLDMLAACGAPVSVTVRDAEHYTRNAGGDNGQKSGLAEVWVGAWSAKHA